MDDDFRKAALDYHRLPRPGKLSVTPTKRMETQRDLGLAYSPGVAAACEAIAADTSAAFEYTARGNLVAGWEQHALQDWQVAILATLVSSSARPEELDAVVPRLRRTTIATGTAWVRSPLP